MKKFIAPEVRVVRYDSNTLCSPSIGMGDDIGDEEGPIEADAPRRRSIFDDAEIQQQSSRR